MGIFTPDFEQLPACRLDEKPLSENISRPENYDELMSIAKILSQPFPQARVDLYSVGGKIFFGEITFFDGSGYMKYSPDIYDFKLGEKFKFNTSDSGWSI